MQLLHRIALEYFSLSRYNLVNIVSKYLYLMCCYVHAFHYDITIHVYIYIYI